MKPFVGTQKNFPTVRAIVPSIGCTPASITNFQFSKMSPLHALRVCMGQVLYLTAGKIVVLKQVIDPFKLLVPKILNYFD